MGDVCRLVSDQLAEDTAADRRKTDSTAQLSKVSQEIPNLDETIANIQRYFSRQMNHRDSSAQNSAADSPAASTRFSLRSVGQYLQLPYTRNSKLHAPASCRINTESRTEATGMKGFLRLCREREHRDGRREHQNIPRTPRRSAAASTAVFHLLILAGSFAFGAATFCPNGCICDDDNLVVSCIGANLDVIPIALNPSIQRIVLKENRIKAVEAAAFQFYGNLKNVDLSSNHLFTIPNGSFEAQKQLVELHLRHNKISALTEKTFQGLKSLTVLNLRDNYLESLKNGLFASLSKLEELDLGKNRISTVEPGAFQKLGSLRVLHLDDNQLRTIPSPALAPLNALAELHIGWNAFSTLPNDAFKGLEQLTVLDITGAGLDVIGDGAFRGLNALRTLELDGNKLREVPTKQLAVLPRLEELTLGQNFFTTLRSGAFQGLPKLKKLDISAAKLLTTVEHGAFSDNANLETLVLNSNKRLTTMEDGSLAGLPNLRHLMLRDNAFTGFSESLVAWNELRRLDLSENPMVCDCSLIWLAEVLVPRNSSPVICAEPPESKGKPIKGMTPDELGCAFSDPRKQALLATLCAAGLAFLTALALILYYRCRRRVRDALKDYKWKNRAISRKEHEYQKTFSDDEYIVRSAHPHHHHHHHQPQSQPIPTHHHHHHLQQQQQQQQQHSQIATGIKPIPVTEL
ncbi:insulin-like growth factor-binding protein complex acid labile subunit isoform X1 [Hylaeus volcanicus]|uniref:insulin-like growth factor-binding protein complex acid labile subunit isoform X1 n=3 Tax=Hylaeus volcanicus TaxID=313075 RepID=UPI0023B79CE9|nr:insulin-like growth factor-binding protein complex acid labile subunit isoform X1 [Hylaeus volcanicus]